MSQIKLLPNIKKDKKTIIIPGSKSYTNRALIMASLIKGKVKILNPLFSDDTEAMIRCLTQLGIKITKTKSEITISGDISDIKNKNFDLNTNLSGTTIRFLTALSCIIPGVKILRGEAGLNKRPIGELVEGLKQLGAKIEYIDKSGFPPIKVISERLDSGIAKLNGNVSSQYFSAIMMIAPLIGDVRIEVQGNQISKPYIDMTIDTMREFGITVKNEDYKSYEINSGQNYHLKQYSVEGDFSSAGYFMAIAALTGSEITLENLNSNSMQADRKMIEALKLIDKNFKSHSEFGSMYLKVKGSGELQSIKINMEDFPDQVQTMAVLASFAKGKTIISGVRSLRVKETERVKALENELTKMNIKTSSTNDTLTIYGGNPKPATIDTYGDHRMAMAFAVAGSNLEGMIINNPEVVTKTFPDFWNQLQKIGVIIK